MLSETKTHADLKMVTPDELRAAIRGFIKGILLAWQLENFNAIWRFCPSVTH